MDPYFIQMSNFILQSASLKKYIAANNPESAVRFSMRGYRHDGKITNIPLYLAGKLMELI